MDHQNNDQGQLPGQHFGPQEPPRDPADLSSMTQRQKDIYRFKARREEWMEDLEKCFDSLVPGVKISVWRMRPEWCKGYQGTIDYDDSNDGDDPLNLDYIRDQFGGDSLQLKFQDEKGRNLFAKTVKFNGVPCRVYGERLETPTEKEIRERKELAEIEHQKHLREKEFNSNQPNMMEMMQAMMTNMQNNFNNQLEMMKAVKNPEPPDPLQQLKQLEGLSKIVDRMRGGGDDASTGDSKAEGIEGMLGGLLSAFGQKNQQQQQAPPQPRIVSPPVIHRSPPVTNPDPDISPAPTMQETRQPDPEQVLGDDEIEILAETPDTEYNEESPSIAEEVAELDTGEIAEMLGEVIGRIGQEKAAEVFAKFQSLGSEAPTE